MVFGFRQHQAANYVPSIEEIEEIKSLLKVSAQELEDIDSSIEQLQRQLCNLKTKRSEVYSIIEQQRAFLSPARRLGRDVLEEIFLACLPENENPCVSTTEAPMLLTHICSSWRSIAHSTPRLWAAIHIVLPNIDLRFSTAHQLNFIRRKLDQHQVAAREWLDRSGVCPLSVSVYRSELRNGHPGNHQRNLDTWAQIKELHLLFINKTLVPYSQRWHVIDLCLSGEVLEGMFENGLTAKNLPLMKKLNINCQSTMTSRPGWKDIADLLSLPLVCCSLRGLEVPSELNDISHLNLTHLTHLDLRLSLPLPSGHITTAVDISMSPAKFASSVLRQCYSLKKLALHLTVRAIIESPDTDLAWTHNVEPVVLPSLTTFSLIAQASLETRRFLQLLDLPSLMQLDSIHFYKRYTQNDATTMISETLEVLLRRCGNNLQFLGLYPNQFGTAEDIVRLLKLTPSLKHVNFSDTRIYGRVPPWSVATPLIIPGNKQSWNIPVDKAISDDLLNALSPLGKDFSDIICPELEVLECEPLISKTTVSTDALKEFVNARRHAHLIDPRIAHLRSIRIPINVNEFAPEERPKKDRLQLGENSAIYFWKLPRIKFSPCEGLTSRRIESLQQSEGATEMPYVVYTEL
ncbi:hypothetical protein BDQ17DRAFT_1273630 [Cyathus striatus]|nr:hypothetical protein BDQ17DRAFT_1273630 [Cyathus striatus]